QGWISGVWGVSSLVGPWLGGVLSDHASWRWVFYVNLPFGAVAMALIATGLLEEARSPRRPVMDLGGVALFAAGVSAVLLGGVGMGMVVVPMLIAVQSAVSRSDLGAATSMTQFFMSVGGAVGLSVMGAVMAQRLHAGLPMADALHGVFRVGFVVCVAAVA